MNVNIIRRDFLSKLMNVNRFNKLCKSNARFLSQYYPIDEHVFGLTDQQKEVSSFIACIL